MEPTLTVGQPLTGTGPFKFVPPSASTQYRFAVTPFTPGMEISIWRNAAIEGSGNGVAKNKPTVDHTDHVCGAGIFYVTAKINKVLQEVTVTVTARSWWSRVFSW